MRNAESEYIKTTLALQIYQIIITLDIEAKKVTKNHKFIDKIENVLINSQNLH